MDIDLIGIIKGIIEENDKNKILPHGADIIQVKNKVNRLVGNELNRLYKEKKISVYNTLNSKAIDIIDGK